MRTIIFRGAAKFLLPLLLMFSLFILLRGHYLPGGGFVGGLIASIAFILHAFAYGLQETKKIIRINYRRLMPLGLAMAVFSAMLPLFQHLPIMTVLWLNEPFMVIGMVGTALLFDAGVYLVVIGVTLTIIFTISESV